MDRVDSGYCDAACAEPDVDSQLLCKQLAAGCGANTLEILQGDTRWPYKPYPVGTGSCSAEELKGGGCALCQQPQWCDDPQSDGFGYGSARTPHEWIAKFLASPCQGPASASTSGRSGISSSA